MSKGNMLDRTIVSALIISSDNKILLGKKNLAKGGVYMDKWHIPGGGMEPGESQHDTLQREAMEEVGLDITGANISSAIDLGEITTPKKLPNGDTVPCHAQLYVCIVKIAKPAEEIPVHPGDDLATLIWIPKDELFSYPHTPPSIDLFVRLGWFTQVDKKKQEQLS